MSARGEDVAATGEDKEGQELLPGGGRTMLQELHALFYKL
jgi:hypothetical protein